MFSPSWKRPMGVVPRDSVMCPFFFVSDPTKLTEEERRLARRFATQKEIDSWQQFGLYLGNAWASSQVGSGSSSSPATSEAVSVP